MHYTLPAVDSIGRLEKNEFMINLIDSLYDDEIIREFVYVYRHTTSNIIDIFHIDGWHILGKNLYSALC